MAKDFHEISSNSVSLCTISSECKIIGKIESKQDIRIDGYFDGAIVCTGKIVIGEGAKVKGEIHANDIDLYGELSAKVVVTNNFVLKSSAVFSGECKTKNLISEPGAQLNLQTNIQTNGLDTNNEASEANSKDEEALY